MRNKKITIKDYEILYQENQKLNNKIEEMRLESIATTKELNKAWKELSDLKEQAKRKESKWERISRRS